MNGIISFFKGIAIGALITFSSIFHTAPPIIPTPTPTQAIFSVPTNTIPPTQTPIPKQETSYTQSNNSSQIECIGPDGKHFWTSMDDCKNLNEKWGKSVDYMTDCNINPDCGGGTVHMSYSQCMKPCSGLKTTTNTTTTTTSNSYQPTSYYSCTLCYHYTTGDNCSAYNYTYKTKEECDAAQANIDSIYYPNKPQTTTSAPTKSPEQEQAAIEALAKQIQACWDSVNASYNQQVHNCQIQFGGSSAAEACASIVNQNRQRDLNACEGK